MSIIIDRRLNDRNKSAVNRERFMRRYKAQIQHAVDRHGGRALDQATWSSGGDVRIPVKDIAEPTFRHRPGGDRESSIRATASSCRATASRAPSGGGGGGGSGEQGGEGDGRGRLRRSRCRARSSCRSSSTTSNCRRLARTRLGEIARAQDAARRLHAAGCADQPVACRARCATRSAGGSRSARRGAGASSALSARRELGTRMATARRARRRTARDRRGRAEPTLRRLEIEPSSCAAARRRRVPFLDEIDLRYRHRVAGAAARSARR